MIILDTNVRSELMKPAQTGKVVDRRGAGRPLSHFDAQSAAIAQSTGAAIATRNVADFDG